MYGSLKAALDHLTRILAVELAPRKIRVNGVNPTVVLTRMGLQNFSEQDKQSAFISLHPLGRLPEVNEVVEPILYLLSEKSSFITGTSIPVEGGLLC